MFRDHKAMTTLPRNTLAMESWASSSKILLFLPIALFMAASVALWLCVLAHMSGSGGWRELASRHRLKGRFKGPTWRFHSAAFQGEAHYHNVLIVGANPQGLYVAIFPLFAFRHPPLLIPWRLVRKSRSNASGVQSARLELGEAPPVVVNISLQLLNSIEQKAPDEIAVVS
jgi:hypothetical protein